MTQPRYVANIELQFTGAGALPDRVHAAADAGFDAVEFWRWEDTDIAALANAAAARGVEIVLFATDWSIPAADPAHRARFVAAVDAAIATAVTLRAGRLVVSLGATPEHLSAAETRATLVDALRELAPRALDAGVTLLLEPVNTLVDHPGSVLDSTADARAIIAQVASPALRLLFDAYHSTAQGEDAAAELRASASVVDYLQLADSPGRNQPGTGAIDWPNIAAAAADAGYTGPIGLECAPRGDDAAALDAARAVWDAAVESRA